MFRIETIEHNGVPITRVIAEDRIGGGLQEVVKALQPYENTDRVLLDFSSLQSIEPGCGMALVQFLSRRSSVNRRTRIFGVSDTVRRAQWTELFLFVEKREYAGTLEEALNALSS